IAWGARAVITPPAKTIRPELAGRCPVIRSKSVVLPAPFGPMRARRSRSAIKSETRSSAASAPKWRDTDSIERSIPCSGASAGAVAEEAGDARGRESNEQDEGEPQDQHPALGVRAHEALQQDERGRAEHGPAERAGSADDDHQERLPGRGPQKGVGRDGA